MIKTVTAQSGGYQYVLDMGASGDSGALIFDIAGIAEHSREITVDKLSTRTVISAVAPKQRVVTLSIRIMAIDVENERKTLRQVFAEGNEVSLSFETDHVPLRTIYGVVESCNNPVYVKESLMTVTVICPDSVFYGTLVTPEFVDDQEELGVATLELTNPGDVSTGCCIKIVLDGTIGTGVATIAHQGVDPLMSLDMAKIASLVGGVQNLDTIWIDSGYKKQCVVKRSNTTYNIFSALAVPYSWILLNPGDSVLVIDGFGGSASLEYRPGYGSI